MPAMKGAKVRRWFAHDDKVDAAGRPVLVCRQKRIPFSKAVPVFIVPATPEAQAGYVEAMANALCCEHMGALPGAYSLTPEKDCAKGSESAYMWRSARAALAALLGKRTKGKG